MKFTPKKITQRLALSSVVALSLSSASVFAQSKLYEQGQRELDQKSYRAAEATFSKLVTDDPDREDAALYWLAYAQQKRRMDDRALDTLEKLIDASPDSPWVDDALALQIEILDEQGQTGELSSDEMKLYALNSLLNSASNESLDTLRQVINGQNSLQVKQRALFVLSQINSPEAFALIVNVAQDATQPALQDDAINVLGVAGTDAALQQLNALYTQTDDDEVRAKVLHGFMIAGKSDFIAQVARSESNLGLKSDAIHLLGVLSDIDALTKLLNESNELPVLKTILDALAIGQGSDALIDVARTHKHTEVKMHAIERLGTTHDAKAAQALEALYKNEPSERIKRAVIRALFIQQNVPAMVNIVKGETDSGLKREALKYLSMMDSEQSNAFFEQILQEAQ